MGVHTILAKRLRTSFLGSGPDRGQSPVEWGEIPYVHTSVRLSIHWELRACQRGLRACQRGLRACQEGGGGTDVRTDGRTYIRNFSPFYRTSSPVGAAAQKAMIFDLFWCESDKLQNFISLLTKHRILDTSFSRTKPECPASFISEEIGAKEMKIISDVNGVLLG